MVYRWFMGIFHASLKSNLFLSRKIVIINNNTQYSGSAVWFLDIWIIPSIGKIYKLLSIFLLSENNKKQMLKKMPNYVLKTIPPNQSSIWLRYKFYINPDIFFSKTKTIIWGFCYSGSFKSFRPVIGWKVLFPSFFKWMLLSLMIMEKILQICSKSSVIVN